MLTTPQNHSTRPDSILIFLTILLCAIGVIQVYSASAIFSIHNGISPANFAKKQLLFGLIGLIAFFCVSRIPERLWRRMAAQAMALNFCLLLVVLVPGIGKSSYGGQRWLGTSGFHVQPSELAVILTILYLAMFFTHKVADAAHFKKGLRPALIVVVINFLLIFAEPDMGTALTLVGTSFTVIYTSGVNLRRILLIMFTAAPLFLILAISASYRSSRLKAFLHPFANAKGSAYQLVQGWTAIAGGHWLGRGFDMSIAKTGYLPFPYTDFTFAVFVEEWGFAGAVLLLGLFGLLFWRGLRIARHANSRFNALLAIGVTAMMVVGTFINLGAVTGLLPVTGIPLPFISYGGTDLVVNMASMGILYGISRTGLAYEPQADKLADIVDLNRLRKKRTSPIQSRLVKESTGGASKPPVNTRKGTTSLPRRKR
jgi:cell division protein FtsW